MTLNKLSRTLYRAARTTRDAKAVLSGDPSRMAKRAGNKMIGRLLGRFWLR